jgi:prepilin-type N-terminal cleavage/methylation domain-containing protein
MEPTPIPFIATSNTTAVTRAFTLVEMMVVLAIIAVISVVTLTGQSQFNQTLILKDTSYAVEYSIRQAQTFGISNTKSGSATNIAYGINFNPATPTQYTFYADSDGSLGAPTWCLKGTPGQPDEKFGDCQYKAGADTLIRTTTFTRGFKIGKMCLKDTSKKFYCTDDVSSPLQNLNIVFARPSPQPILTGYISPVLNKQGTCANIYLIAPTGNASTTIRVSQYGEMSINQTCP